MSTSGVNTFNMLKKFAFQVKLLLWKRYCEFKSQPLDLVKLVCIPFGFFILLILIYQSFDGLAPDGIEEYFVPFSFLLVFQKVIVNITHEKSNKLKEALKIMGLLDVSYWVSYFISEGVIIGFLVSFLCAAISASGLFNDGSFGDILLLFWLSLLAGITFAFFLSSFFELAQSSSQFILFETFAFYIIYLANNNIGYADDSLQKFLCFFPPMALQLGSGSFKKSYVGISRSTIYGILFADIFIYAVLTWYFSQVWSTGVGVAKPWHFIFQPAYWFPTQHTSINKPKISNVGLEARSSQSNHAIDLESGYLERNIPIEAANEAVLGKPTVVVDRIRKVFGSQVAVNKVSFNMYENQIFALLGHNGAGKSTTINMLTGLLDVDDFSSLSMPMFSKNKEPLLQDDDVYNGAASIYGLDVGQEMSDIRKFTGYCPQHDVLFDHLTVREHILLAAQLKGYTYEQADEEAVKLTKLFHLDKRLYHVGAELSGGQKRKLSVALAICGGSKFVVLDEPTAGMDPLARRELWDLLASLRQGRTMLLTTHYMDEADILGDRIGIMSLGSIKCLGSPQFLKSTYGSGYKLIFDKSNLQFNGDHLKKLSSFVSESVPGVVFNAKAYDASEEGTEIEYMLPFQSIQHFASFFNKLEKNQKKLNINHYGITMSTLEEVFLAVGEDDTVKPKLVTNIGIGSSASYQFNFVSQVIGIAYRRLNYAIRDKVTIALLGLPMATIIVIPALYKSQIISSSNIINDYLAIGLYVFGYLGTPGLIAEFLVRERANRLRNVLTVMGCSFQAYWLGNYLSDLMLMMLPLMTTYLTWVCGSGMTDFYIGSTPHGLNFLFFLVFAVQFVAFSYLCSFLYNDSKSAVSFTPALLLGLVLVPYSILLIFYLIFSNIVSNDVFVGILYYVVTFLNPLGAMFTALVQTTGASDNAPYLPLPSFIINVMIIEALLFSFLAYYLDCKSVANVIPKVDTVSNRNIDSLDVDVKAERHRVEKDFHNPSDSVTVKDLVKEFPNKKNKFAAPLVAVNDVTFGVKKGEIFGLLGANGAGKSTLLSMLTRHVLPTSGDAFIGHASIQSNFIDAAKNLGVVTQNNSLWDLLSVEDHLFLFARIRGVPEEVVKSVVEATIDQLELRPHRKKLSMNLSGGMKRKLCVAIALIGDPRVVLLDEPSAGLDPASRRNLWRVILDTMSHRSVILTTHSMEEAEALCKRIGIMVKGQLRVLGTKQYLKSKFSSGYEFTAKLKFIHDKESFDSRMKTIEEFVKRISPSANLLSNNGGLMTFRIPQQEMLLSKYFQEFENMKVSLGIEDYSISQPTLEQVFIQTVLKEEERVQEEENEVDEETRRKQQYCGFKFSEYEQKKTCCGCLNFLVKYISYGMLAAGLLMIALSFGSLPILAKVLLISFGILFLILAILGAFLYLCSCCQRKEIDKDMTIAAASVPVAWAVPEP